MAWGTWVPASDDRFRLLFEAAPTGVLVIDEGGTIVLANARATAIFGFEAASLAGEPVERLVPERSRRGHPGLQADYLKAPTPRPMGAGRDLYGRRCDGSEFPVEIGLSPIEVDGRRLVIASVVDITERTRQAEHIQVMMHELAHRSKNLLTVIQAIAHQTLARCGNLEEFKQSFDSRLSAVAQTQNLLLEANWVGVPMTLIVAEHLRPFVDSGARIEASGPDVVIKPDLAQRFGLALHELATNATKYGALSSGAGRVLIAWSLDQPTARRRFTLSWRETGGPPPIPSGRRGFGHRLLAGMKEEGLCDHVDIGFDREGFRWTIECSEDALVAR